MCYSKEVQLLTASIILLSCLFYYVYFKLKFSQYNKKPWLIPFLNHTVLAFVLIGIHQLFEFLTLVTGNQVIYKLGLLSSISVMYFALRSFEILTNKKIYSKLSLILIAAVTIHLFLVPLSFAEKFFYVQHQSTFFWGAAWLVLFTYWHICAWQQRKELKDDNSKKMITIYLLAGTDIAFILSVIYSVFGSLYFGVNYCYDSPSIWCTFMVIQALFVPLFLSSLPNLFNRPKSPSTLTLKQLLVYLIISLLIVTLIALTLPLFDCFTWKFVFP